jgi:RNA 2',3'-cyclic 3'-phosphodiesterase
MSASERASLGGRERPRLFVALPLPAGTVRSLAAWQGRELAEARAVRVVPRENLHITIAFLGGRPAVEVERIFRAVRAAADGMRSPTLVPARYRETRSVGMLVFEDEERRAGALAERVFTRLEEVGVYEREKREWLPHVTVLRFSRPPRLAPPLPDLGEVSPSEVALYHSVLRPGGAQYEIVESVALGG